MGHAHRAGDVARRDRDHGNRRCRHLCRARRRAPGLRDARRCAGRIRRGGRLGVAAAAARAHALVSLRCADRRDRNRDARQVTYTLAIVLGVVAGVFAGMFGVGGGILFVPTLTWLGLTQLHAEAMSLLAIVPTVVVGVWRQQRYGNVRWRSALVIGLASVGATIGGAQLA